MRRILSPGAVSALTFKNGPYRLRVVERHEYVTPAILIPPGTYDTPKQARAASYPEETLRARCPMCGSEDLAVAHLQANRLRWWFRGAHLRIHCTRCSYRWREAK